MPCSREARRSAANGASSSSTPSTRWARRRTGNIVVIDEIHTPDSSRFWFSSSYAERFENGKEPESFDKEYVRRWLAAMGFKGDGPIPTIPDEVRIEAAARYAVAFEQITGSAFVPDLEDPAVRIPRNLGLTGG